VKVKFTQSAEFVVVGWEADAADGSATLSSLLLAYYDGDELRFAGKVGSGLSGRESAQLKRQLTTRRQPPWRTGRRRRRPDARPPGSSPRSSSR